MGRSKLPFHTKDYTYDKEKRTFVPLLEILIGSDESRKKISAYVDTGCTTCMHFCRSFVEKEGLKLGTKMNNEPIPFLVADGHTINGDYYKAFCNIAGEEKEIVVSVIDPEKAFKEERIDVVTVEPLLGLGILHTYDVLFKGKEKRILFFRPE